MTAASGSGGANVSYAIGVAEARQMYEEDQFNW